MTGTDFHGNAVTTSSPEAIAALDRTIDGFAHFTRDAGDRLKAVFEADAEMPLAHILRGYFFKLLQSAKSHERACKSLEDIKRLAADATMREQGHAAALEAWCNDDLPEAVRLWDAILVDHPRDYVAVKLSQYGHFYQGDSANVRDTVGRCLHAWSPDDPLYPSLLGLLAFGLEESGAYGEAERTGKEAVRLDPEDPWSIHAVAHVFEMQDRHAEGVAWITGLEQHWDRSNNFRYHLWWHRALMHLGLGETDEALRLYDEDLFDAESRDVLDFCNDSSLLARLELHGVDVGDRWTALAEMCRDRIEERLMAFTDAHFGLGLAASETERASEMLSAMRDHSYEGRGWTDRVTTDVGVPILRAMIAWRAGDFGDVVDQLMPVRNRIRTIGGSNAQRDLFSMILIDAAMRDGRWKTAVNLLSERAARHPVNAWTQQHYATALDHAGEAEKAAEVRMRLASLA
jgi:tetratricopeptide (TPR) repeat protein